MKVSRAEAEANRRRIIDRAAALFRERGFDGVDVAELMKADGLTYGGFYGHFASKDESIAEACLRAIERTDRAWPVRRGSWRPVSVRAIRGGVHSYDSPIPIAVSEGNCCYCL